MCIYRQALPLVLLVLALTGCTSASITNLTASQQTRNRTGLYPVEAIFDSGQQSLLWDSIKPNVVVDNDFYPMRATPLMKDRWETVIPVPAGTNLVYYHFKFDFQDNGFGTRTPNSKLSPTYRLEIKD